MKTLRSTNNLHESNLVRDLVYHYVAEAADEIVDEPDSTDVQLECLQELVRVFTFPDFVALIKNWELPDTNFYDTIYYNMCSTLDVELDYRQVDSYDADRLIVEINILLLKLHIDPISA